MWLCPVEQSIPWWILGRRSTDIQCRSLSVLCCIMRCLPRFLASPCVQYLVGSICQSFCSGWPYGFHTMVAYSRDGQPMVQYIVSVGFNFGFNYKHLPRFLRKPSVLDALLTVWLICFSTEVMVTPMLVSLVWPVNLLFCYNLQFSPIGC